MYWTHLRGKNPARCVLGSSLFFCCSHPKPTPVPSPHLAPLFNVWCRILHLSYAVQAPPRLWSVAHQNRPYLLCFGQIGCTTVAGCHPFLLETCQHKYTSQVAWSCKAGLARLSSTPHSFAAAAVHNFGQISSCPSTQSSPLPSLEIYDSFRWSATDRFLSLTMGLVAQLIKNSFATEQCPPKVNGLLSKIGLL